MQSTVEQWNSASFAGSTASLAQPLRVLMVTARYYPLMGGTETHTYEVARRLAAEGVQVTIGTTDPSRSLPSEERTNGVTVVRVPAWPAKHELYVAPGITQLITAGQWDIVHCQSYHTAVPPMAMLAARYARLPYVVTFHSGGSSSTLRSMVRGAQQRALGPLLRGAARLIAVSPFEARLFSRRLGLRPEQLVVIPNGANVPQVAHVSTSPDEPLILSVGRLERYKGHQRVIAAMPQLLRQWPKARLRVLGAGPYEAELRAQVAQLGLGERVEIGAIPPSDRQGMARALGGAALVVLLSDYEAHPVAAMEALAAGRPLLVAATAGLQDLVDQGWATGIAPNGRSTHVAAAIDAMLARPPAVAAIALPTWEGCASALHQVYRDVAATNRVGRLQ